MKTAYVAVVVGAVGLFAVAQPPGRGGPGRGESVEALEAQLALLKRLTAAVEEKLRDARRGPAAPGGGRGVVPPFARGGMRPGAAAPKDQPMPPRREGEKREERREGDKREEQGGPNRGVEERLERLAREIEEIRRTLRR